MNLSAAALALLLSASTAGAFHTGGCVRPALLARPSAPSRPSSAVRFASSSSSSDEEEEKPENPYADPNYPDLEFVNYDDPGYVVDQGIVGDEFFPTDAEAKSAEERAAAVDADGDGEGEGDVEAQIEEMREDRRRKNDEYQFETYHERVLKNGDEEYRGEWTLYRTSTFLPSEDGAGAGAAADENGLPRLVKARKTLRVVSSGRKIAVETDSDFRVDGERIVHEETVARSPSSEEEGTAPTTDEELFVAEILSNKYWPDRMSSGDFRGPQGIMCVGNAYTICDAVPLSADGDDEHEHEQHEGPFAEYRAEVGIQYKRMRMRVKLDYRAKEEDNEDEDEDDDGPSSVHPPLYLRSMAVCRETTERWPRHEEGRTDVDDATSARLFGPPGAPGGLYDPPPVVGDDDEQAGRYMMVDLEGGATLLFPHRMEQDPGAFGGNGWVTSLDWTPGRIRYQVDRKVMGGYGIKGLRSLELSEVQGQDASEYRPNDGGEDMRQ